MEGGGGRRICHSKKDLSRRLLGSVPECVWRSVLPPDVFLIGKYNMLQTYPSVWRSFLPPNVFLIGKYSTPEAISFHNVKADVRARLEK